MAQFIRMVRQGEENKGVEFTGGGGQAKERKPRKTIGKFENVRTAAGQGKKDSRR